MAFAHRLIDQRHRGEARFAGSESCYRVGALGGNRNVSMIHVHDTQCRKDPQSRQLSLHRCILGNIGLALRHGTYK